MKKNKNEELDPRKNIIIKGARVHNLKNVSLAIPRNQLTVITGLSGSGKSSLAFDTLFAEGQRRYVESLSSYARQFLGRLDKPDVDTIQGISPAVAIEQKVTSRTSRSTVGTTTEIYDYMKLLYARIGKTFSPISGKEVKRHRVEDVIDFISKHKEEERYYILAPVQIEKGTDIKKKLEILEQQGFSRIKINDDVYKINEVEIKLKASDKLYIVIDRVTGSKDEENLARISDSVGSAFFEGRGICIIELVDS
jgi:excinuclease ABC subunit A